jgi:hypothetical protein
MLAPQTPQNWAFGSETGFPQAEQYLTPGAGLGVASSFFETGVGAETVADALGAIAPPISTKRPGRNPEKSRPRIPEMMSPALCWLGVLRHMNQRIEKTRERTVITPMKRVIPNMTFIMSAKGGDPGGSADGGIVGRIDSINANNAVNTNSPIKKMI